MKSHLSREKLYRLAASGRSKHLIQAALSLCLYVKVTWSLNARFWRRLPLRVFLRTQTHCANEQTPCRTNYKCLAKPVFGRGPGENSFRSTVELDKKIAPFKTLEFGLKAGFALPRHVSAELSVVTKATPKEAFKLVASNSGYRF